MITLECFYLFEMINKGGGQWGLMLQLLELKTGVTKHQSVKTTHNVQLQKCMIVKMCLTKDSFHY